MQPCAHSISFSHKDLKRNKNILMSNFINYIYGSFFDRSALRTYAHDDVSVGSWMIGLAVNHVNEAKLCCSSWPSGWLASLDLEIDSFFV
jgi:hypothetical protein